MAFSHHLKFADVIKICRRGEIFVVAQVAGGWHIAQCLRSRPEIIIDPLEWGDEAAHTEHLLLLQEKINTCIAFIEREEIYSEIPDARGKHLIIRVLGLHALPEQVARPRVLPGN